MLPFVNLSGNAEDEYFGDGMAEEIITALAKIQGLHVVSRTSAFAFKDRHLDIWAIGELLNVGAVLEGSVRRSGNTLRVTAQLISTADGYHLWAGRFDRERKDIVAIHDDIALNIARALSMVLGDDDWRAIARAYAGIADACAFLAHYYEDEHAAANLEEADASSRHALALDPQLAEAHAARGFLHMLLQRFAEAEAEFGQAIQLDPNQFEARYFHARTCFQRGELPRALELVGDATRVRDDPEALYFVAQTLTALNRPADAEAAYRNAISNHSGAIPASRRWSARGE